MNTATTGPIDEQPDILEALQIAKSLVELSSEIPASFKVRGNDAALLEAGLRKLHSVETKNAVQFEYAGMKIIEDDRVPPGFIHVCNADGEVLQRFLF